MVLLFSHNPWLYKPIGACKPQIITIATVRHKMHVKFAYTWCEKERDVAHNLGLEGRRRARVCLWRRQSATGF